MFTLAVTRAPDPAGTRLTWAQAFPDREVAARVERVGVPSDEQSLGRLGAILAGGSAAPRGREPGGRAVSNGRTWLRRGALCTAGAALLHLAIIAGGPAWYRFFGAGERMARMAAWGHPYPALLTAAIAGALGVAALYGLSGAGVVRPLPLLRPVLALVAGVFLARGLLGIPVVLLAPGPYAAELRGRMVFMAVTSAVCVVLGACYAAGLGARRGPDPGAHG